MIDIILVHGIEQKLDAKSYYNDFVHGIQKKLPIDAAVTFHPINWSLLLEQKEKTIYSWMAGLGYQRARFFGCTLAADVLAYANTKRAAGPGDFYFDVTKLLQDELGKCEANSKKIIISHSQGTQISLDFIFDKKIDCFITMGSPILYGSPRFKDFGQPPPELGAWYNFYNYFDPISTPISKNPNFANIVKDISVKSLLPLNWLPIRAHTYYWASSDVIEAIAKIIESVL